MLGEKPTIVDFSMAGYVHCPPEETGFDIAALPGWKLPYNMMPVGVPQPMRAV